MFERAPYAILLLDMEGLNDEKKALADFSKDTDFNNVITFTFPLS